MAYKICPACGAHNDPSLFECAECEADLTGVELAEEQTEDRPEAGGQPAFKLVRVCDCGHINPPQARKCEACHEDISDIDPTEPEPAAGSGCGPRRSLISADGLCALPLGEEELVIGRSQGAKDYLLDKPYVSRIHARLSVRDGEMYIEDCASTNGTFVNNVLIGEAEARALNDGDEIGLGGCQIAGQRQSQAAYFTVRISR